ncbi:MAG: hypothetical protein V4447_10635 [Pseudomonadota bacterium]
MRYYDIRIIEPSGGKVIKRYSSLLDNGQNNLSALNVELDIPIYRMAEPSGQATLRIWGISLVDIGQAFNLNGKSIQVFAGMSKGLPLANPKQAGLILQGTIQQCFGNWQDTSQTLDFVVNSIGGSESNPKNFVVNWRKGMTLGEVLRNTLSVAAPTYKITVNTSSMLVLNQDEIGYYETLPQLADWARQASFHIMGSGQGYQGLDIIVKDGEIIVSDGTTRTTPKAIIFTDLIGQPAWNSTQTIQFKTVMRADLNVDDYISLPKGPAVTSAQSYAQYKETSAFKGEFRLTRVRHVGNFRQPVGDSWVTVLDASVSI